MKLQKAVVKVNPFRDGHFRVYWGKDGYRWGFYIGWYRKYPPSPVASREECEKFIRELNTGFPVYFSEPASPLI